jgi:octopine/nopaline transport system substrate-binding protein
MRPIKTAIAAAAAALCATAFVPVQQAAAKDWKQVVIGTEGAYAPWNMTKADGTLDGFEVDLIHDLCQRMKVECKLITQDWDTAIPSLVQGKYDVLMDAVSITPERQKEIAFSEPYAQTPATFAAVKDTPMAKLPGTGETIKMSDPDEKSEMVDKLKAAVKGKSIGIQTATVYTKFVEDNFKDVATIREYKTAAEHDLDLASGRIDLAFDDATYFLSAFKDKGNGNLTLTGPQIAGTIWGPGEGFGFRQSDTDLIAMFNKAIDAAKADGTIKKLSMKWFGLDVVPQ